VPRGYVLVNCDLRGFFRSEGEAEAVLHCGGDYDAHLLAPVVPARSQAMPRIGYVDGRFCGWNASPRASFATMSRMRLARVSSFFAVWRRQAIA
jgi:hypothetical protein